MWKTIKERLDSPDAFVSMILGLAAVLVVGVVIVNMITAGRRTAPQITKEATSSATPTPTTLPATHTVSEGETLWSIAEQYYKSGYNWVTIRDANKLETPDVLAVGQKLTLPPAKAIEVGQTSSTSTQRITPKTAEYTVRDGDSLWTIAVAQYGTGYAWPKIAGANSIRNPDLIYPGEKYTLPVIDSP
jgi:nucleoid-associated protein YgaU